MSGTTTNPTIAPFFTDSSISFDMKNEIEKSTYIINCSNDSSSSNSDSAQQFINISTNETQITASECIQNRSPQNVKENVDHCHDFDAVPEQNIFVKFEPTDSLEESHSSIPSNVSNNDNVQLSLCGFTFKTEEQRFGNLGENRKAVLQPIVYDNAKNCSYNQKELSQTHFYQNQQFQRTQYPFQPKQFTIFNQMLPNGFQGLSSNSNRKYSNAFQLILNGFQPHTNVRQTYVNVHDSGVAQFNPEGIQPSQLPTSVSQSYQSNNHSLPNDLHQHPLDSLAQLTASQSSSTSSKLQSCKNPPFSNLTQPNGDKPSQNNNHQLFDDNLSQSTSSTSMKFPQNRSLSFPGVGLIPTNGNKPSKNVNQQLLHNSLRNSKTTVVDAIAHLEKYFRGDTCLLCGFKSSAKRLCNARKHLVTHLYKRDFKCSICGKGFVSPEYQLQHEKSHSKKDLTFQCRSCDHKFRSRVKLSKHEKTHDGIKLQCPLCDMQLATRVSLKSHLTIHTGELPYQCSECSERFRTSCSLRLHVLKHTGEKRFICDVCGKGFNNSGMYKQHLGTHESGAAFQCDKCEKTFNFRSNLAQHRKTHSEDRTHECGECGKKFKFPHHLRSHVATHGPIIKIE